jgi:hypothetical protein
MRPSTPATARAHCGKLCTLYASEIQKTFVVLVGLIVRNYATVIFYSLRRAITEGSISTVGLYSTTTCSLGIAGNPPTILRCA